MNENMPQELPELTPEQKAVIREINKEFNRKIYEASRMYDAQLANIYGSMCREALTALLVKRGKDE